MPSELLVLFVYGVGQLGFENYEMRFGFDASWTVFGRYVDEILNPDFYEKRVGFGNFRRGRFE